MLMRKNQLQPWSLLDSLFDEGLKSPASFSPACDVEETDSHFLFRFDVPGMKKDDLKIEVEDHQLVVSGERAEEREEGKKSRHFSERYYGSFQRVFTLPSTVDTTKVEADYRDGVLSIAVPKTESVKPRQVKIGESKSGIFQKMLGNKEVETSGKKVA